MAHKTRMVRNPTGEAKAQKQLKEALEKAKANKRKKARRK